MRSLLIGFLALSLVLPSLPVLGASFYAPVERSHASFRFEGGQEGKKLVGQFRESTASFSYDPQTQTLSRVRVAVATGSLHVPQEHWARLSALFDTASFSEITFSAPSPTSLREGKASLEGVLSLRGQKQTVSFEVSLNSQASRNSMSLILSGQVKRDRFGLVDSFEAEDEKPLGDTLHFDLEFSAVAP